MPASGSEPVSCMVLFVVSSSTVAEVFCAVGASLTFVTLIVMVAVVVSVPSVAEMLSE